MDEQFQRHSQIGKQFFDVGSYERATREFESALQLQPENNYIRLKLTRCWIHLEKLDKARHEIELALQTNPNDSDAHYLQSYTTRKWKAALVSIEKAIALKPENSYYFERRGFLLTRLTRYKAAIESLEQALALAPDLASNHRQMADTLFDEAEGGNTLGAATFGGAAFGLSSAKYDRAKFHVKRALELDPEHARSHSMEARLRNFEMEFEASLEKWQEVLRLNPTDKYSQIQFQRAQGRARLEQWQKKLWRVLYRWMPWPLRLPLTAVIVGLSFWWGVVCKPGVGLLSGDPIGVYVTFSIAALMMRLLLRDWLQFVPDRFVPGPLRSFKKPPLR